MPKNGSPKKTANGVIPKNKSPGPIEKEANYRKDFPGAGAYSVMEDIPWNERGGKNATRPSMEKAPRLMMADIAAKNNMRPEKSTPSPMAYSA
jgi:hypothetical protein